MDLEAFDRLRKYETTSWACWSENEDCSVGFFCSQIDILHGRAIFVGLNRSEAWQGVLESTHMSNFHTPGHTGDRRLKRHIQDAKLNNLFGGFMTDVSEEIKTDSGQVKVNPTDATMELIGKVISVDDAKYRFIICLGDKAFDTLRKGLKVPRKATIYHADTKIREFQADVENESWRLFRVWHSANYGKFIHKSELELPLQLIHINEQMSLAK